MMLISKKIMMKQPKHFPFSKTNICPCSQQTFYLAERTRETEARQLWVVGRSEVGRCLVGSGRWVVGGRLPQRWGRAGEVSSKQTHNYSYSCVCLSSLLCALQTKLPILTHRPPLLLRLYSPPPLGLVTRWLLLLHLHSAQLCPIPFAPTAFDRSRAIVCVNKHFTIQHKLFLVLVIVVVVMLLPSMLE